jgi:hypothetical protein
MDDVLEVGEGKWNSEKLILFIKRRSFIESNVSCRELFTVEVVGMVQSTQ